MKISTKGRYALRVMIDLTQHDNGEYIALKDIANRQQVTVKYLEQIVSALNKAGMLVSMRGNNGGHRLARPAGQYTVGEILRVMEGDLSPVDCVSDPAKPCPMQETCATIEFWRGLGKVVNDYVDSFTLQDLADRDLEGQQLSYSI